MTTPEQQALAALLSFSRSARTEGRSHFGSHWLGESPSDHGYRVSLALVASHDAAAKSYVVALTVTEWRYENGHATQRLDSTMPSRTLATVPASRFSSKRLEAIYSETLAALKLSPAPLIDLLTEESQR